MEVSTSKLARRLRPPARNRLRSAIGAAKRGQPPSALTRDERLQSRVHDRGLFADAAQLLGPLEQLVIDDQGSSHMHKYGRSMHTGQSIKPRQKSRRFAPIPFSGSLTEGPDDLMLRAPVI